MDKNKYIEYSETLNIHGEEIEVIVQVPENPDNPIFIIDKSGSHYLKRTLEEWSAINEVVQKALEEEGYEREGLG